MTTPRRHPICAQIGHDVSFLDKQMVKGCHPFAQDFLILRRLYDGLKHAAAIGSRFFSFIDEDESAILTPPMLQTAINRPIKQDDVEAGQVYVDAILEWQKQGWPIASKPTLAAGHWTIKTRSFQLVATISEILANRGFSGASFGDWQVTESGKRVCTIRVSGPLLDVKLAIEIAKAISLHHGQDVEVTEDVFTLLYEGEVSNSPIPLAHRPLLVRGTEKLEVTPREVLVPTIGEGVEGLALLAETAKALIELIADGYAAAEVEKWLAQYFTKQSVSRMLGKPLPVQTCPPFVATVTVTASSPVDTGPEVPAFLDEAPPLEEVFPLEAPPAEAPLVPEVQAARPKIRVFAGTGKESF